MTMPVSGKISGMNERIESQLSMVGLRSRSVNIEDLDGCRDVVGSAINRDEGDRKLDAERLKADIFHKRALL